MINMENNKQISLELLSAIQALNDNIQALSSMAFKFRKNADPEMAAILNILDQQTVLINQELDGAALIEGCQS